MLNEDDINWITDFRPFEGSPQPKNFFDIGLRGHFENPMSDILSFYLDPRQDEHGLGDRLLATLVDKLGEKGLNTTNAVVPKREWRLEDGKRIDIVMYGEDWVLVIENKVLGVNDNDFPAYRKAIEEDKDLRSKKTKMFCLLTPFESCNAPDGWSHIDSLSLLKEVRPCFAEERLDAGIAEPSSTKFKWMVLFDEFIDNLKQISGRRKVSDMTDSDIEEYSERLEKFYQIQQSYERYHQDIRRKLESLLKSKYDSTYAGLETISSNAHGWAPQARGFKFRPFKSEEHEILFLVCADKIPRDKIDQLFQIRYCLRSPEEMTPEQRKKLAQDGFTSFATGRDKSYNCFYSNTNTFEMAKISFLSAMQAICDYRKTS
jgi:hypothetical protein